MSADFVWFAPRFLLPAVLLPGATGADAGAQEGAVRGLRGLQLPRNGISRHLHTPQGGAAAKPRSMDVETTLSMISVGDPRWF